MTLKDTPGWLHTLVPGLSAADI